MPLFCKLTLNNDEEIEIIGSGELKSSMVSQYLSTIKSVEIGELCTSIGSSVFYNCSSMTNITISNTVTNIDIWALYGCSGLTTLVLPNQLNTIGSMALFGCSGLTTITIPSSVTNIANGAFKSCTGLDNIISLATTAPTIVGSVFSNMKLNGTLYVPIGSTGYDSWMSLLQSYNWTMVEQ